MNKPKTPYDLAEATADAIRALAAQAVDAVDWDAFAQQFERSRRQLDRIFTEQFGRTPAQYLADLRAAEAKALLADGYDVLRTAAAAGYSGPGRLHEAILRRTGMTPGEVRAEGRGVVMSYAVFPSPVGPVLLAATKRGVSALRLIANEDEKTAIEDLRREFRHAELCEDADAIRPYAEELVRYLRGEQTQYNPALDIHGTAFQREVWAALQSLATGETATYSDIAEKIGRPKAVRAVASACARNPVAIVVPCHRIIRRDGGQGGYRWGLEWKEWLQEFERGLRKKSPPKS